MTMLLERIHRAASARSMTNNSQDAASVGASVGTFEFEMDVVRDSQQQRQKRRGRRSILGAGIIDHCDSSADDQKSHEELTSMKEDHDSNNPHREKGSHSTEHDASDRSFSFQTNSTGSSSGLSSILPNRTISLSMIIGLLGIVSSTLFLGFGIDRAVDDQDVLFSIRAHELGQEFNRTWNEYILAALWVNQACSFNPMTRNEFKRVFHFVNSHVDVEVSWQSHNDSFSRSRCTYLTRLSPKVGTMDT